MITKPCALCGALIETMNNLRYCSPECRAIGRRHSQDKYRNRPDVQATVRERRKRNSQRPDVKALRRQAGLDYYYAHQEKRRAYQREYERKRREARRLRITGE